MLPKHWARRLKIHEALQRSLCRAAVLVAAVLPVVGCILVTIYWCSPWYAYQRTQAIANTISDACGIAVQIDSVSSLSRNRMLIKGIELQHPETFERLAAVEEAIAERVGSQWHVHADKLDCSVQKLLAVARVAHDRFLCRADDRLTNVQLVCESIRLVETGSESAAGKLQILFVPKPERSSLHLSIQPTPQDEKTVELQIVRSRHSSPLATTIQVETNGIQIPMHYLSGVLDEFRSMGASATFEGNLVYESSIDQRLMIAKSMIRNYRWESVTANLPYSMTGQGELYLDNLTLIDGRVHYAGGYASAFEGSINSDWLARAQSMLGMTVRNGALNGAGVSKPFTKMTLLFQMNEQGLLVKAKPVQTPRDNVILWDADGPLLAEPMNILSFSSAIQWLTVRPVAQMPGMVAQANYHSTLDGASESTSLAAYLMTKLPVGETIRR